jgi:membrane protease YdiL (CAAX protease family)
MNEAIATGTEPRTNRYEGLIFLSYFIIYWIYLFAHRENEWMHWLTLVLIPVVGLYFIYRSAKVASPITFTLRSIGLRSGNLTAGLPWAFLIGLAFSLLQLAGRSGSSIMMHFRSGAGFYLWPLSFLLMCVTAATTEELFFRGVLQSRLVTLLGSRFGGIIVAAFLFGLYHLPYAYFRWSSAGNWAKAIQSALETGVPLGLLFGWLYERSHNLLAPIVAHALTNSLPGMLIVDRLLKS